MPRASPTVPPAPRATVPTGTTISAKPYPIVGGLLAPEEGAWYAPVAADPLAALLSQSLHRSLLEPRSGEPWLATEWTMRGSRATFTLPDDTTWSDGSPLRAADVADILLQASEVGDLTGLAQARAVDAQTLELTLTEPLCPALMRAATWPIVDARDEWPPVRTSSALSVEAVGRTGWAIGPDPFEYHRFPNEVALRAAWENGEINTVVGATRLTDGPLSGAESEMLREGPLLATLLFRLDDPLLQAPALREALTLATDRAALFEDAYGGEATLLTALLPPDHWAAPQAALPSNPTQAARLLTQAGWQPSGEGSRTNATGEPLRLTLTLPLSPDTRWEALGHALAAQWAEVGVAVEISYAPLYALQERLHTARWQVALVPYLLTPDPDQRALWSAPTDPMSRDLNVTGYQNPAVAELLAQGAQVSGCALPARARFYREAWALLLAERPLWPLFPLPLDMVHQAGVHWSEQGR